MSDPNAKAESGAGESTRWPSSGGRDTLWSVITGASASASNLADLVR